MNALADADSIDPDLEKISTNVGIPPRPGVLVELVAETRKDEPDLQKIEKLVSADVALSAALLKTINSPFYGLRTKASTIKQAIPLLGLAPLSRLATGMALRNSFSGSQQADMESFWDASAKLALTASYIAKQLPGMNKDEAYTFGLFQDCGIPVLMQRFPAYPQTLSQARQATNRKFTAIEEEVHGTHHATIGYLLARNWCLPETTAKAIRFHHEYAMLDGKQDLLPVEGQNLVALALLAERSLQLYSGQNDSVEWLKGGHLVLGHLGLSGKEFEGMAEDIKQMLDAEQ